MLGDAALNTLFGVIGERWATAELPPPLGTDNEASYTRAFVLPIVKGVLDDAGVESLLLGGQYTGINRPVTYLGIRFFPDVAVMGLEERLIAIEVKFLRGL